MKLYVTGMGLVVAALLGVGIIAVGREHGVRAEASERKASVEAGPPTLVTRAKRASADRKIELQAEARAYTSVTLYAKVSGYLKHIKVDKGDHIKTDQVLAILESPELDRQYEAAVADAKFKRSNAKRTQALLGPGVVSNQEADAANSSADVAEATVAQLASQRAYEVIKAPIDGVVTARFLDPGALVQNGASPIVAVADTGRLRVFAYVGQGDAPAVRVGTPVEVSLPERPSVQLKGTVDRVSDELDPKTRTMLAEMDVDNSNHDIVAGSYVNATLHIPSAEQLEVPAEALILRGGKSLVALISDAGIVHLQEVNVMSADGRHVVIRQGITEGAKVALNPGGIAEGEHVQVVEGG